MACNLNFNQCNTGCHFPRPIFNCRCRFLSILNSSNIEVVRPTPIASIVLSTITPQTLSSGGAVSSISAFSSGSAITINNSNFLLTQGHYLISYSLSGTIASNGMFSSAFVQDGFTVIGSESSTSGTPGMNASITNSAIIDVTGVSSILTLTNINTVAQVATSGNITIQKLT